MEARYLRQLGTTKDPLPWTEALAKRHDMVPFDPEEARIRIATNLRIKNEVEKGKHVDSEAISDAKAKAEERRNIVKELHESEKALSTLKFDVEQEPERQEPDYIKTKRQGQIDRDKELAEIRNMVKKGQIEEYMARKYGKQYSADDLARMTLKEFKEVAVNARIGTLYEIPDEKLK